MSPLTEQLRQERLVAIIRGNDAQACVATALTLVEEGVRLLEVSLTSTDALRVIERVAAELDADHADHADHAVGVSLGAGTVLSVDDVRRVRDAGATYVVTPAFGPAAPAAVAAGLPLLAGALTPSEIVASLAAGADAVKIFPASVFGPDYLKALAGPFPDVPFVPVGGVGASETPDYLRLGATAVGVGSPLCGDAPDGGDLGELRRRTRAFLSAVARDREASA